MNKDIILLILVTFSLNILLSQTVIRGPYLQKGTPTSIVLKWRTDVNDNSVVEYSTDAGFNTFSVASDASLNTDHEIEITGLSPYTIYYYRLGTSGSLVSASSEVYFRTHPMVGSTDPYTFWILGHIGNGALNNPNRNTVQSVEVRDQYYNYIGSNLTDGIILNGDNADTKGRDDQYQESLFEMFETKLKNTLVWSCFGNLDAISAVTESESGPYYDIFTFPKAGESGGLASGTESYYSFDYGNVHFIVLNSHDEDRAVGGVMYNWALNDIQNTTQPWVIALWHHPPYSKGYHTSEGIQVNGQPAEIQLIEMRENFVPMLESNGVDLVISGHSESYERSYLINGHYGLSDSFDPSVHTVGPTGSGDGKITGDGAYSKSTISENSGDGTVYLVTSTASRIVGAPLDHNAMYYSVTRYGSCVLEVHGNNLSLKFLRNTGVIEDEFTIHKGPDYVFDGAWQDGKDPNGVSTNLEDIAIVSGTASITSNTISNTLVVNPGAKLSINSGVSLTANRIVLESDSDDYSVLNPEATSTVNGLTRYERYTNQIGSGSSGGNDLISSPVTSGSMETFGAFADWNKNMSGFNDLRAFAPFNNNSGNFDNFNIVSNDVTPLVAGKGYRAATDDGSPLVFTGNVSVGNVSTTIDIGSSSIWNLVGNPYTSYLDSQEFIDTNGQLGNDILDQSFNAIYGYNAGTDGSGIWTIINNIQNTGKNIAPGQGFFVASNGTGGIDNLLFTPAMRTLAGNDDFILGRTGNDNSIAHLKLSIQNSSKSYFTDLYFTDNASLGLDPGYDAGSFDATNAEFSLYSHLVNDNNGVDMAIQAISLDDLNNVSIPLGLNVQAGESVLVNINESDIPDAINVYLEDNLLETVTLLNSNSYSFETTEELNGTGRFFLHLTSTVLSNEEEVLNGLQIYTLPYPKTLNVKGLLQGPAVLDLYDIHGRRILTRKLENRNSNIIDVESIRTGVYVVKLKMGASIKTEKVIIR